MRTPGKDSEWRGDQSLQGAAEVRAGAGSRAPLCAAELPSLCLWGRERNKLSKITYLGENFFFFLSY